MKEFNTYLYDSLIWQIYTVFTTVMVMNANLPEANLPWNVCVQAK